MPKVTRGPARQNSGRGGRGSDTVSRPGAASRRPQARAKGGRAPSRPSFFTHWRNQFSASLRTAHYRAGAAARLFSIAAVVLIVAAVAILSGMGRMDATMQAFAGASDDTLRRMGFRLETIDVAGAEAAPFEDIRSALGLDYGDSIFSLDLEAARARVEELDWVGDAQVFRLLPNRVQVVVSEQIPLARWQIGGQILVIDVKGAPIEKAGASDYAQLPLVVGEGAAEPAPSLLEALAQFPEVGRHVEAGQRVGMRRWTLFLDNGAELHLPEHDWEAALAIASNLQAERSLLSAPAQFIDMRNADQIVVRPLQEEVEQDAEDASYGGEGPERKA